MLSFKIAFSFDQRTYPQLPDNGSGQLQLYSFIENCKINFELNGTDMAVDSAFSQRSYCLTTQKNYCTSKLNCIIWTECNFSGTFAEPYELKAGEYVFNLKEYNCPNFNLDHLNQTSLKVFNEKSYSYSFWFDKEENNVKLTTSSYENPLEKPDQGK